MSIRDDIREELIACSTDKNRDTMRLQILLDDHAMMPGFSIADGELENKVIIFLHSRGVNA